MGNIVPFKVNFGPYRAVYCPLTTGIMHNITLYGQYNVQKELIMSVLFIDCDGVLIDWHQTWSKWLNTTHPERAEFFGVLLAPQQVCIKEWDQKFHDSKELEGYIHEFRDKSALFLTIPPVCGYSNIKMLVGEGKTFEKFHIITHCGGQPETIKRRVSNIEMLGMTNWDGFDGITCLNWGQSKGSVINQITERLGVSMEDCLFVDDNPNNIVEAVQTANIRCIQFLTPFLADNFNWSNEVYFQIDADMRPPFLANWNELSVEALIAILRKGKL